MTQAELFAQIEDWVIDILMSDQLTKTDHRLFWYLFKLDRFGDRYVELPSQAKIALALGVSRKAINESQAKLQNLGLWDFRVTRWKGRNLAAKKVSSQGVTKRLQVSPKGYSQSPEGYSQSPEGYSPESETQSQQDFQESTDYTDLPITSSDSCPTEVVGEKKQEKEDFNQWLKEVSRQLKEIRINPADVLWAVKKYPAAVESAIAYTRQQQWADKPAAAFVKACKEGLKPEATQQHSKIAATELDICRNYYKLSPPTGLKLAAQYGINEQLLKEE